MYFKSLTLAVIVLAITIYIEIKQFKEKGFSSIKALIGIAITLMILVNPLFKQYEPLTQTVYTIFYSLQALVLNADIDLIADINAQTLSEHLYVALIYALFLIAPLITATSLLSLLGNTFSKLKIKFTIKKELHIFSEINERTIALAQKIKKDHKSSKIIFMNSQENNNLLPKSTKIIKFKETIMQLNLNKINKKMYIYFMSQDEDTNLNNALEFLEKHIPKKQTNVYVLNSKQEAYMLIDSYTKKIDNEKIRVEVVNEVERTVYQRLKDLPIEQIFLPEQKEVTVLIIGCGRYGQTFLKAITWCFHVIGYKMKILVVEPNSNEAIKKISLEAPELLSKYEIQFINKDIETVLIENDLKEFNINYAVILTNSDSKNFDIAIALRRHFLINKINGKNIKPVIDILTQNEYKSNNISILKTEKDENYNINCFGSIIDQYQKNSIIDSDIEKMAKNLHLIYNPKDVNLKDFYKSEYNKKSSRAMSVHIKYKLYSILGADYTGNIKIDLDRYKQLIEREEIKQILAQNEHDRWMAYLFTDGYRLATIDMVKNYYLKNNNHKDTLARLHPALVEFSKLDQVERELNELVYNLTGENREINLKKYDYEIIQKLDKIVDNNK